MFTEADDDLQPNSEPPRDAPSDRWMDAMVELFNCHHALRPKGFEKRQKALRNLLWDAGANQYVGWVLYGKPVPVDERPDAEIAALKAVEANMGQGFYSPDDKGELTRDQQQELRRLVSLVIEAVKDRLRELEGDEWEPKNATVSPFEGFGPKTRLLLNFLWDQGRMPRKGIPSVMRKLKYRVASLQDQRAFSALKNRANADLSTLKDGPRYEIDKDKKNNTIYLIKLPS